ncbi:hypothetical protein ANO14919_061070 [Xylariales sp. No.14919]|nr:hypothetical protein ANO14919_061070 [Xylariales sp. No.14919]
MRFLMRAIGSLGGSKPYGLKTGALYSLLVFKKPPPRLYPDLNMQAEAVPFTCHDRALKLVVGRRSYRL